MWFIIGKFGSELSRISECEKEREGGRETKKRHARECWLKGNSSKKQEGKVLRKERGGKSVSTVGKGMRNGGGKMSRRIS